MGVDYTVTKTQYHLLSDSPCLRISWEYCAHFCICANSFSFRFGSCVFPRNCFTQSPKIFFQLLGKSIQHTSKDYLCLEIKLFFKKNTTLYKCKILLKLNSDELVITFCALKLETICLLTVVCFISIYNWVPITGKSQEECFFCTFISLIIFFSLYLTNMLEEKLYLLESIKCTGLIQKINNNEKDLIFVSFFVCVLIGVSFQFEILFLDTIGLKSTFIWCRLITK